MHQKFDKVFDLVKQKVFYPYETLFNETLPSKKEFYSLLSGRGISDKKYQHVLKVSNESEMKTLRLSWFVLKMQCFIVTWCIWKICK